jgi:hypothetical protein
VPFDDLELAIHELIYLFRRKVEELRGRDDVLAPTTIEAAAVRLFHASIMRDGTEPVRWK